MPTGPIVVPAQAQNPLQQYATSTPQPATATPQLSAPVTAQATAQGTPTLTATVPAINTQTVYRGIQEKDYPYIFVSGRDRLRMLSNVGSTDFLEAGAMSVFETPSSAHPYNLPLVITYSGEKTPGQTTGTVSGIVNNEPYELTGAVAVYDNNPAGHWTIGFVSVDLKTAKNMIVDYAALYFGK